MSAEFILVYVSSLDNVWQVQDSNLKQSKIKPDSSQYSLTNTILRTNIHTIQLIYENRLLGLINPDVLYHIYIILHI